MRMSTGTVEPLFDHDRQLGPFGRAVRLHSDDRDTLSQRLPRELMSPRVQAGRSDSGRARGRGSRRAASVRKKGRLKRSCALPTETSRSQFE